MAHQRELIRKAVRQAIEDAATAAGTRVYATRVLPYRKTELPAIAVYTLKDDVTNENDSGPRELDRTVELTVEGWVKGTDETVDDLMDDLALQIEVAIHAEQTFGGEAADTILTATELEVFEIGDRLMGVVVLTYNARYFTLAPEPSDLDDFITANTEYNLGGEVDPNDIAIDNFVVQCCAFSDGFSEGFG